MKFPMSFALAASLLVVWAVIAHQLHQPIWTTQRGQDLMSFGAAKGSDFGVADWWKIFTCQWLHMKLPHLVLNVVFIALLGLSAEKIARPLVTLATYLVSGTAGVMEEMLLSPTLVVSGASQAMVGLAGFVLVAIAKTPQTKKVFDLSVAILAIVCTIGLDLCYEGSLKIGHLIGFAVGAVFGLLHHTKGAQTTRPPVAR